MENNTQMTVISRIFCNSLLDLNTSSTWGCSGVSFGNAFTIGRYCGLGAKVTNGKNERPAVNVSGPGGVYNVFVKSTHWKQES